MNTTVKEFCKCTFNSCICELHNQFATADIDWEILVALQEVAAEQYHYVENMKQDGEEK